jgi:hypothetical protein
VNRENNARPMLAWATIFPSPIASFALTRNHFTSRLRLDSEILDAAPPSHGPEVGPLASQVDEHAGRVARGANARRVSPPL